MNCQANDIKYSLSSKDLRRLLCDAAVHFHLQATSLLSLQGASGLPACAGQLADFQAAVAVGKLALLVADTRGVGATSSSKSRIACSPPASISIRVLQCPLWFRHGQVHCALQSVRRRMAVSNTNHISWCVMWQRITCNQSIRQPLSSIGVFLAINQCQWH